MIKDRLDLFLDTLFFNETEQFVDLELEAPVLKLKLERNASEQIKFAHWLYGDGLSNCAKKIKKLILSDDPKAYFQFDYAKHTFTLNKPVDLSTDDFYYLFDYLKELYRENDYHLIEGVKESRTEIDQYTETERYVLVNNKTNHLINLEVINDHMGNTYIIGLGYPVDELTIKNNDPTFFRIIKDRF